MKTEPISLLRHSALLAVAATTALASFAHAADLTWGGGDGNWSDINWNPGPVTGPTAGTDTATIHSGSVSLNVGGMNVGTLTLGAGGTFNAYNWNGVNTYTAYNNVVLQGGTLHGLGNYHNWGAGILKTTTVSGSAPSTISASSFFNLDGTGASSSVFDVADVTGDPNADLHVSATLADVSADFDWVAAALVKAGAGTMRLTSANLYSGGTTVDQGTLLLDGGNSGFARIKGPLTVNSGASVNFANDDGTGLGWQGYYKVTSLAINGGTVSSAGTIHVWDLGGGINMTGGTLQSNNGVSDPNGPQLEWNWASVTTHASEDTATIGGRIRIRGDGGYGAISFSVADGDAASDLLVSAAITEASGGMGISKGGAGTMTLTGSNSYTGATTVSAGTLIVNGNISTSVTTVQGGATLGGTGTVGTTTVHGTLAPGESIGTLDISGALTLSGGSISNFEIEPTQGLGLDRWADLAAATGIVTYGGTLNVLYGGPSSNFANGMVFNLFDGSSFPGSFSTVNLPTLAGGLSWQDNLASNGTLVVIPEPGSALLGSLGMLVLLGRRSPSGNHPQAIHKAARETTPASPHVPRS